MEDSAFISDNSFVSVEQKIFIAGIISFKTPWGGRIAKSLRPVRFAFGKTIKNPFFLASPVSRGLLLSLFKIFPMITL